MDAPASATELVVTCLLILRNTEIVLIFIFLDIPVITYNIKVS